MSALVISSQQMQRVWIPDLEGPQIQYTLQGEEEYHEHDRTNTQESAILTSMEK